MKGISIREFARRDGCNDKLVRRAISEKKLAAYEDGSLDPALVGSGWRKQNRKSAPADSGADNTADKSASVRTVKKAGRQQVERVEPPLAPADLPDEVILDAIERILRGEFFTTGQAEKIKENALAAKHLLEGRKKAGELIEMAVAEAVLFEEFRSARDAWLNFPLRVGPLMAAEVGIDQERMVETLKHHVHQQLIDLGEPEPDFGGPDHPAPPGSQAGVDPTAHDQRPGVGGPLP